MNSSDSLNTTGKLRQEYSPSSEAHSLPQTPDLAHISAISSGAARGKLASSSSDYTALYPV
jgi:hypothetical protein